MIAPHEHRELFIGQSLTADAPGHPALAVDRQVHFAQRQGALECIAWHAHAGDRDLRGHLGQLAHQARQGDGLEHVAHAQAQGHVQRERIEGVGLPHEGLQPAQVRLHLADDTTREFGGHHLVALAHEQRVAPQAAQAGQRVADGGLAQVQVPGRARDAAMLVDRVHDAKEVQVEAGDGVGQGHGVTIHRAGARRHGRAEHSWRSSMRPH